MDIFTENIVPFEKIINKQVQNITFKEIISLIFHAIKKIIDDKTCREWVEWAEYYDEFTKQLSEQEKKSWPKLVIIKNDYNKRIDIFSTGSSYVSSNNIFTLIFRLLCIENYKRGYIYKSYNYHKILGHKLNEGDDIIIQKASLETLFDLLKKHIKHYLKIYDDDDRIENLLAKKILDEIV